MDRQRIQFEEPGFAKFLFASTSAAWLWLVVRVYLGYEWAHAGWDKVFGEPSWVSSTEPLTGFVGFALTNAGAGEHSAVNYGWYAAFLRWVGGAGRGRRQPGLLRDRGPADPGLAQRRLHRPGPFRPAGARNALGARDAVRQGGSSEQREGPQPCLTRAGGPTQAGDAEATMEAGREPRLHRIDGELVRMDMIDMLIAVDGNEAAARVAHRLSEVIAIYPITPS